jgi:hypothetical protein
MLPNSKIIILYANIKHPDDGRMTMKTCRCQNRQHSAYKPFSKKENVEEISRLSLLTSNRNAVAKETVQGNSLPIFNKKTAEEETGKTSY